MACSSIPTSKAWRKSLASLNSSWDSLAEYAPPNHGAVPPPAVPGPQAQAAPQAAPGNGGDVPQAQAPGDGVNVPPFPPAQAPGDGANVPQAAPGDGANVPQVPGDGGNRRKGKWRRRADRVLQALRAIPNWALSAAATATVCVCCF